MSDFFQSDQITTLQHLRPNIQLDEEVKTSDRRFVVVVPCLVSHYKNGQLRRLLHGIATVPYISELVVVLNGPEGDLTSKELSIAQSTETKNLPVKILVCEGVGKGRAIKLGFDYIYARYKDRVVLITIDADFQSFSKEYFLRLAYPIAVLGGHANKGYYARFSPTTLNGRLTRLVVFPMLYAIQGQCPTSDLNQWFLSFRYPLSGDVALASEILPHLNLEDNWAYDLSLLTSLFPHKGDMSIYQTELIDNYEHSHRDLADSSQSGLIETFADISTYLMGLFPIDRDRLISDYRNLAKIYCDKYKKLALFNGIKTSNSDRQLVDRFIDYLDGSTLT